MMPTFVPRFRRSLAGLTCAALMAGATGCSGDKASPEPASSPVPSSSTGASATLDAKPVPMDVEVVSVAGRKMKKAKVRIIEHQIGKLVSDYFDAAFLAGDYPRTRFSDFPAFSKEAAQLAGRDRAQVTNQGLGASTEQVVPKRKWARLSVLRPNKIVVGVTAGVRLVFVAVRPGVDQMVTVSGRLMVARAKSGRWQIFGYDLSRSFVPAEKGGMR